MECSVWDRGRLIVEPLLESTQSRKLDTNSIASFVIPVQKKSLQRAAIVASEPRCPAYPACEIVSNLIFIASCEFGTHTFSCRRTRPSESIVRPVGPRVPLAVPSTSALKAIRRSLLVPWGPYMPHLWIQYVAQAAQARGGDIHASIES